MLAKSEIAPNDEISVGAAKKYKKPVTEKAATQKKIGSKSFKVAPGSDSARFDKNQRRIVNEIKTMLRFKLIPE